MLNMLQNLYVKNLALIDETEVEFGEGLNILTGETGAGKSLLLGSVHLALGGKYSPDMLRNGTKSGLVELTFKIEDEQIEKHLEEMNLYPEDGFLTLSRRLMEGRSISKINGETVNTGILKDVASMLIDIHGQRDNQTLLHKKNHLTLLDLYGKEKIVPLKKKMAEMYRRWNELKKRTESLTMDEETRRRELSLAEFEAQEMEELYRKMTESRKVTEAVAETYHYTGEAASGNASDLISRGIRSLQEAADFDEEGSRLYEQLTQLDGLLNDFNRELSEYAKSFEFSEEEFRETEDRLNLLNHLKAKYGRSIEAVLAYCDEKKQRLQELADYDTFMQNLEQEQQDAFNAMKKMAEKLSQVRQRSAKKFAEEICGQMKELNFLDSRFEIRISEAEKYSSNGKDEAEFYLSVNPGEPLKPLGSVASGGEISRVMLAVKTVLADEEDTPTLIFDEIDTGISGITAGKVGDRLRLIGKSRQVICITHLPQIAATADHHFLIRKKAEGTSVRTDVEMLDEAASVEELARLLGGANVTERVMESAKELKELAKCER